MSMQRISKVFALALAASLFGANARGQDTATISAAAEYERGIAALDAGQPERAEAAFRAIVERAGDSPLAPRAFVRLVRILGSTNRIDEARAMIEKGRQAYAKVPEVRDQLDALQIHLNARRGRPAKVNPQALRKRLAEMERQAAAARAAGDMAKAMELQKARAQLARRNNPKAPMRDRQNRPGAAEAERMRQQQEAMIARAHELEDKGQTEEAYALRKAADELARKAEAARRPRNNGRDNKNNNNQRRRVARRLRELRNQLRDVDKKLGAARAEGNEAAVAELSAVRENFVKESRQLEERLGQNKNKGKNNMRRQLNQARKAVKKARKVFEKAREKGQGVEEAQAKLAVAEKALAALEARGQNDQSFNQGNQLERLSKILREQGADEGEIKEQLTFARAERAARQALNEELAELREKLTAEGLGEDALRKRLKDRRQQYNRESRERRGAFNKRVRERRSARFESQVKKRVEALARRLAEEGVDAETAGRRLAEAERGFRQEARNAAQRQAEQRRERARENRAKAIERQLKQARKRLENSGASQEEIKKKLAELRERFERRGDRAARPNDRPKDRKPASKDAPEREVKRKAFR